MASAFLHSKGSCQDSSLIQEALFTTIVVTVLLSIVLHGLTAAPAANAYGRTAESMKDETDMPEMKQVSEMPTRAM